MGRTRVRRRRWTLGLCALGLVAVLTGPVGRALAHGQASDGVARRVYVVRPGDTIWKIATALDPGADPRPLVAAIAARNGISAGDIQPGQALVIPRSG